MTKVVYIHAFGIDEEGNETYADDTPDTPTITGWCVYVSALLDDGNLNPDWYYPEWDFDTYQEANDKAESLGREYDANIREY